MKKLLLLFIFAFIAVAGKAQVGYNYKEFSVGLDISYQRGYTNVSRQDNHVAQNINFTYNYSPYIPLTAELQFGTLSGGGTTPNLDPFGRMYTNHYEGLILHGDLGLGEVIDYDQNDLLGFVKNFYFGTGIGFIFNNNTVQRTNVIAANGPTSGSDVYVFPGSNSSVNITIPLRFGYEIKFYNEFQEPFMAVDIGYTHSMVFGEGLDGYDDPQSKFKNNASNQYRQILVGVKFSFGNITSYNKVIRSNFY